MQGECGITFWFNGLWRLHNRQGMYSMALQYITVTSQWVPWRLTAPASRLFSQQFVQEHIKENVSCCWPLWGESNGHRWIPLIKGKLCGKCFPLTTSSWRTDFKMTHGLTHWGRVTHICVGNLTIIGSDNGLSPGRRQAITWNNVEILLGTNLSEMLIEIHTFSFKKIHLKMSSGKWRPFCLGFNVLTICITILIWHYRVAWVIPVLISTSNYKGSFMYTWSGRYFREEVIPWFFQFVHLFHALVFNCMKSISD